MNALLRAALVAAYAAINTKELGTSDENGTFCRSHEFDYGFVTVWQYANETDRRFKVVLDTTDKLTYSRLDVALCALLNYSAEDQVMDGEGKFDKALVLTPSDLNRAFAAAGCNPDDVALSNTASIQRSFALIQKHAKRIYAEVSAFRELAAKQELHLDEAFVGDPKGVIEGKGLVLLATDYPALAGFLRMDAVKVSDLTGPAIPVEEGEAA